MSEVLHNMNTEDYNTMRDMISEIELKLMGVDPIKQKQFYLPLQNMIFMAWEDACNPNDSFLFGKKETPNG
jgi:hypothetical protein